MPDTKGYTLYCFTDIKFKKCQNELIIIEIVSVYLR